MPMPAMFYNIIQMDLENLIPLQASPKEKGRKCECLLTSEKIRHVLSKFPSSQPITPDALLVPKLGYQNGNVCKECIGTRTNLKGCHLIPEFPTNKLDMQTERLPAGPGNEEDRKRPGIGKKGRAWGVVVEVIQLLQLAVVATALAVYYLMYGWMLLIYTALRLALYFRQADRPMKITLGVVAVTSLVVGLNVLLRVRKLYLSILR